MAKAQKKTTTAVAPKATPTVKVVASPAGKSAITTRSFSARSFSADRRANALTFFGTRCRQECGMGGKATPPPAHWAARMVPCRARPVPFCLHGFRLPPATAERFFAAAVPWRRLERCAFTTWCKTLSFTIPSKTFSGSARARPFLPSAL